MNEFDIVEIQKMLTRLYEGEFKLVDSITNEGEKEICWKRKNDTVTIRIGHYTCEDERYGKPHIGFMWWNGTTGLGSPCNSIKELLYNLDKIKMPKRYKPIEEQLSLW